MQHRPLEILDAVDDGDARKAADAGRKHNMLWMQDARCALANEPDRPAASRIVIARALERGPGPEIDIQDVDIALQPVRDLVLRNVFRKGHRERQIAQMIDRRLVVQLQPAIAQPPIVADALLVIDDKRGKTEASQLNGCRDAGMAAADDEHVGIAVVIG